MSSTNSVAAYGAGGATGQFNPLAYIRKPEVILRLVAWVSSFSVPSRLWAWPSPGSVLSFAVVDKTQHRNFL